MVRARPLNTEWRMRIAECGLICSLRAFRLRNEGARALAGAGWWPAEQGREDRARAQLGSASEGRVSAGRIAKSGRARLNRA